MSKYKKRGDCPATVKKTCERESPQSLAIGVGCCGFGTIAAAKHSLPGYF
ncbi:hypothetical protein [Symmachiella macrocystis]|nr:hypothetical protein [Symmachiella macrocystis]